MADYIDIDAPIDVAVYQRNRRIQVTLRQILESNDAKYQTADVPPVLWTDDPIVGTEFMTHNQGQHGFEIHFRTDNKEKYEAVQSECRRQIGHAKPAADVVPVGAYNQAAWERDTAIEQLKQIGKSFGEQMDDVRPVVLCKDCKHYEQLDLFRNSPAWSGMCHYWNSHATREDGFCFKAAKKEET